MNDIGTLGKFSKALIVDKNIRDKHAVSLFSQQPSTPDFSASIHNSCNLYVNRRVWVLCHPSIKSAGPPVVVREPFKQCPICGITSTRVMCGQTLKMMHIN